MKKKYIHLFRKEKLLKGTIQMTTGRKILHNLKNERKVKWKEIGETKNIL